MYTLSCIVYCSSSTTNVRRIVQTRRAYKRYILCSMYVDMGYVCINYNKMYKEGDCYSMLYLKHAIIHPECIVCIMYFYRKVCIWGKPSQAMCFFLLHYTACDTILFFKKKVKQRFIFQKRYWRKAMLLFKKCPWKQRALDFLWLIWA